MKIESKIANEFFRCLKAGWSGVGRQGDYLAYVTKTCANGNKHKLYENGIRILERADGVTFRRNLDGIVTRSAFDGFKACVWTEYLPGKYKWVGGVNDKILNYARQPGVEFVQGTNGMMSKAVKTNNKGYTKIIFENGKEQYILPDGSSVSRDSNGIFKKSNNGYRELTWGRNSETGHYGWQGVRH